MSNPQSLHALLEQTGWMHALARRLVSDPHLAADLAQDAVLDALEREPAGDRPLRGWLATVMRNKVSKLRRGERHRAAREDAARRTEAEPGTLDVVERAETHRNVVLAVLALPEPYKSTLLLRFFEQLSYDDIARRTGVTRATVNSRVTRGLAELRQRLESTYGDRRALGLALIPLAKLPEGVATTTTTILGLKTMHFAIATTATLLAATASVALLTREPEPVSGTTAVALEPGPSAEPRSTELLPPPARQSSEASEASEPERVALAPEEPPAPSVSTTGQESDDVWSTRIFQALTLGPSVESLRVSTGAGDVKVRASTSGQLEVVALVHARRSAVKGNQLSQVFADHVDVREEQGVFSIEGLHQNENGWSIGLVVSVPAQLSVSANSGSGDVEVSIGSEQVQASTGSGDVLVKLPLERLKALDANSGSGDVVVEVAAIEMKLAGNSGSGDVTLRIADVTSPGTAFLNSGSGSVTLVVPHGINGSFGLQTQRGEIVLPASFGIPVERGPQGGSRARGVLGSGGGEYEMNAGSGNIEVLLGNALNKDV